MQQLMYILDCHSADVLEWGNIDTGWGFAVGDLFTSLLEVYSFYVVLNITKKLLNVLPVGITARQARHATPSIVGCTAVERHYLMSSLKPGEAEWKIEKLKNCVETACYYTARMIQIKGKRYHATS